MGWQDIFTRNIGWKITSLLLAVLTWITINTFQAGSNPGRFQGQALTEQRVDNTAIIPLAAATRVNQSHRGHSSLRYPGAQVAG